MTPSYKPHPYAQDDIADYLLGHVAPKLEPRGACGVWSGATVNDNPVAIIMGTRVQLRRMVLEHNLGRPMEPRERATTTCGNRRCLNPEHVALRWVK